jgi:DNA-damage-inducible protein D
MSHTSAFERIRHSSDHGADYWLARELGKALGYRTWQKFHAVVEKAMTACATSGQVVDEHFNRMVKPSRGGNNAVREIEEYQLSRYACYLIVQNGDPNKPVIALGQTYFAVQTRRAEIQDELVGMREHQRRMAIRRQIRTQNVRTAATAYEAGVITHKDFAIFQDHGCRGLYHGATARDIAARKGLRQGQEMLDDMGSLELAANLFRSTQAEDKIRREGISTKEEANAAHEAVGRIVRRVIIDDLGGTPPELLPTPRESIRQLAAQERKRQEIARFQPVLFADDGDGED